jgi:hypothetical protein
MYLLLSMCIYSDRRLQYSYVTSNYFDVLVIAITIQNIIDRPVLYLRQDAGDRDWILFPSSGDTYSGGHNREVFFPSEHQQQQSRLLN